MSSFDESIKVIMTHEGGWVDNPNDAGRETNFGWSTLTIKSLGLTAEDLGIPGPMFTPGYLKPMKAAKAAELYKTHFWDKFKFGTIVDQTVATKCVDMAINMGPRNAAINAQKAINSLMPGKLTVDGVWGPMTFGVINNMDPKQFIRAYSKALADYYEAIIVARPQNAVFRKNWLKRAQWGM